MNSSLMGREEENCTLDVGSRREHKNYFSNYRTCITIKASKDFVDNGYEYQQSEVILGIDLPALLLTKFRIEFLAGSPSKAMAGD